jgi:hypothetical protein
MYLLSQIIYSCKNALHVLGGLSVHHQELNTSYTATVYVKQLLLPAAIGGEIDMHGPMNIKFTFM